MPLLIPLALSLAPELAKWLFGGNAAAVTQQVGQVIANVTGTPDPDAAQAALLKSPELAAQARVQLAQIAAGAQAQADAAAQAELVARLGDVAGARAQTLGLAQARSPVVYAAPLVSVIVLVTYGLVMWLAVTHAMPVGSESILNMLLGTLGAMAMAVVSYWVGSSAGSVHKSEQLAAQSQQLAGMVPLSMLPAAAGEVAQTVTADALNAAQLARR